MLEIRNLVVGYNSNNALADVSLSVPARSITTIIGNNGAGKTTLLRTVSGLLAPRSGEILLNGERIDRMSPSKIVELGISHVPEGRELFSRMSVYDNLVLGAFLRRDTGISRDLDRVYEYFPVLKQKSRLLARNLSGGEQQMLAFGRALMTNPKVLLLDEPSVGLAPLVEQHLIMTVKTLAESEKLAVLLVEQNANLALSVSDNGYVFELGSIVASGTAARLQTDPIIRTAYLGL